MNVKLLRVVNAVMALDFLLLLITVVLRLWMPYEVYRVIHPFSGFLLVLLVAAHIYLNKAWIKQNYFKKRK